FAPRPYFQSRPRHSPGDSGRARQSGGGNRPRIQAVTNLPQVVIVGGGISGVSAAYDLAKAGIPHTPLEKQPRLGGVIETRNLAGCVTEAGPDSFLASKPEALALIKELGLSDEVIGSNDQQRTTYILRHGKLVKLPEGVMMIVPSRVMPM